MIEQNKIYNADCLEIARQLPDGCVNLLIADPPYFEVKGAFDFVWPNFEAYLSDVEKWAAEFSRILSPTGTLFWYGHALKIAYAQVIFDRHLTLLNSLVWEKTECQTKRADPEQSRRFAPVTERILMYSKEKDTTGLSSIMDNPDCFQSIKAYMRAQRKMVMQAKGFTKQSEFDEWINEITETRSIASRHYFADSQFCIATPEIWAKMQATGFFQREYEDLRREYEDLRRPFNNETILTDVLKFSQETHITRNYEHDTKKPETMTRSLILTCSRKNDLIFVPFAGSGTECAMAAREGRRFIGCEIDPKHHKTASDRTEKAVQVQTLF